MAKIKKEITKDVDIVISPPNMRTAVFLIRGTAPYVQNRFSEKAKRQIQEQQEAGKKSKSKTVREPKDFTSCYKDAMHISTEGWYGIPAASFRAAMVSACRLINYKMTLAKLAIVIEADGFDKFDNIPLVRITKGESHMDVRPVRINGKTIDLRARPMWDIGWEAKIKVRYDVDQFSEIDIANLLMRVGIQVGIGEGRNDGKQGCGMGWGSFELLSRKEA